MSLASDNVAIAITTFNRADLLAKLLDSIALMEPAPDLVVVVDNASTDDTALTVQRYQGTSQIPIHYERLETNVGGAGGFATGIEQALALGAHWVWVMDDDVEVLPDALASFSPWTRRYGIIHGRRYGANGEPFFWQHDFSSFLGVPLPVRGDAFGGRHVFHTNVACFEGMFVSREVIAEHGLPDSRFFINGDDTMFGWNIAQQQPVALINSFVLRKGRNQRQIDLGIRHLNDSSDLSRYYVMRNRGLIAQYLKAAGQYSTMGFGIGTFLTFGKEMLRLVAVEHTFKGAGELVRGWRDSKELREQSLPQRSQQLH